MKFNELRIQRMGYGDDKGKIIAKLEIEGRSGELKLIIPEPASLRILKACADVVADAGAEQAAEFRREFMQAVNSSTPDNPEGGAR